MNIFSKEAPEEVSFVLSSVIIIAAFSFIAGYYWGKRNAAKDLQEQFDNGILADKIAYAAALGLEEDRD